MVDFTKIGIGSRTTANHTHHSIPTAPNASAMIAATAESGGMVFGRASHKITSIYSGVSRCDNENLLKLPSGFYSRRAARAAVKFGKQAANALAAMWLFGNLNRGIDLFPKAGGGRK